MQTKSQSGIALQEPFSIFTFNFDFFLSQIAILDNYKMVKITQSYYKYLLCRLLSECHCQKVNNSTINIRILELDSYLNDHQQ